MQARTIIRHGLVVGPKIVKNTDLCIEDNIITQVADSIEPAANDEVIDATGKYIIPGFIDVHNHGAMGFDATFGSYQIDLDAFSCEPDLFAENLKSALQFYRSRGVTRTLLTTMASPHENILESLKLIDESLALLPQSLQRICAGINIEGTFLKMPAYAGAQNPDYFADADVDLFDRLNEACGHRIKMVNVPPEQGEKGMELIEHVQRMDIAVAGGHTGSSFDQFTLAVDKGLSLAVHFFNGPSRSSSKPFDGGGAEEAMLYHDKVSLELILDGYHVNPLYVRDAIARKGVDGIVGITDSMFVNGLDDVVQFSLAGLTGQVSGDRKYLHQPGGTETLFGSVLSMDRAYSNLLSWLTTEMTGFWYRKHEAYSLEDALVAASQMCSLNAAHQIGLGAETGSIEVGKAADLLIVDLAASDDLEIVNLDLAIA